MFLPYQQTCCLKRAVSCQGMYCFENCDVRYRGRLQLPPLHTRAHNAEDAVESLIKVKMS